MPCATHGNRRVCTISRERTIGRQVLTGCGEGATARAGAAARWGRRNRYDRGVSHGVNRALPQWGFEPHFPTVSRTASAHAHHIDAQAQPAVTSSTSHQA